MIRKIWALNTSDNAFKTALDQIYGRLRSTAILHNDKEISVWFPLIPLEIKERIKGDDMYYSIPEISSHAAVLIYWDRSRMRFFQNDKFI